MSTPPKQFKNFFDLFKGHVRGPELITSDHSRQAIKIEEFNRDGHLVLSISGMTWNTMNFGTSFGASNNPFKADESFFSFINRKKIQMGYLLQQITAVDSDQAYSPADFILLQEADWLALAPTLLKPQLQMFIADFKNELLKHGWALITPEQSLRIHGRMVILYNSQLLQPTRLQDETGKVGSQRGIFPSKYHLRNTPDYYNTGHEVIFTHVATGKLIALTNIHFDGYIGTNPDLSSNYSQQILDYQFTRRSQGILTVIGGDTNRAQNIDQIGLIGARDYATQFGGRDVVDGSLRTRRVATRGHPMEYPKRYDGFFAGPSSTDTRIEAIELKGMYFSKWMKPGRVRIFANYLDPKVTYRESLQRKGQMGIDTHIHTNGYYFDKAFGGNMTFGWPFIPNRIKLFLVRVFSLRHTDRLIITKAGAPNIDYCNQTYYSLYEEAIEDFKNINETNYAAIRQFEEQKRHNPALSPLEFVDIHETLHRKKLEENPLADLRKLYMMHKQGREAIIKKAEEQKQIAQAQKDQAEGWTASTSKRCQKK